MDTVRLAVITDSHLCSSRTPYGFWNGDLLLPESWTLWGQALAVVAASAVDGVLLLGDITNFAETDVLTSALRTLAALGVPVLVVAGNHDAGPDGDAVASATERLGRPSITVPKLTPSAVPGLPGYSFSGVPIREDGRGGCRVDGAGGFLVAPESRSPLLLLSHYPVIDCRQDLVSQNLRYPDDLGGATELAQQIQDLDVPVLVIHGHLHVQHAVRRAGVLQLAMPPLVEWPYSVSVVILRDGEFGPSIQRTVRSVRDSAVPAGRRTVTRDERWEFRDGRWNQIPLSYQETRTP